MNGAKAAGDALTTSFDRIYVINMPHRADRRAEMARELGRVGLGFDHPQVMLWPARPFETAEGFPSPAVRGCFDSHLRVIEHVAGTGIGRALVLEDDADFARDAEARLPGLCRLLDARDWGLVYGWPPVGAPKAGGDAGLVRIDPAQAMLLAHFYGVSGAVAPEFAAYLRAMLERPTGDPAGGPMHFDGAMNWFRRAHPAVETVAPAVPIAQQRPSRSDIHAARWYDHVSALAPAVAAARRIKGRLRG